MSDCLFCNIIAGDIPATIMQQDEDFIAFRDINPQAPVHILIIPRKHIATVLDIKSEEEQLLTGKMIALAANIAHKEGIAEGGYRLVFNCNADGGQEVYHIHLHLLGGRSMQWPPG